MDIWMVSSFLLQKFTAVIILIQRYLHPLANIFATTRWKQCIPFLSFRIVTFKNIFKFLVQFLKVTFHLQLLQNIGYIPSVIQYNLEPILHPLVCASHPTILLFPF